MGSAEAEFINICELIMTHFKERLLILKLKAHKMERRGKKQPQNENHLLKYKLAEDSITLFTNMVCVSYFKQVELTGVKRWEINKQAFEF